MTPLLPDWGPSGMPLSHEDTSAALKIAGLSHPCLYTRLAAISCDSIIKWSYHAGPSEGYIRWATAVKSKHPGGGMRRCFQRHHQMCSTAPPLCKQGGIRTAEPFVSQWVASRPAMPSASPDKIPQVQWTAAHFTSRPTVASDLVPHKSNAPLIPPILSKHKEMASLTLKSIQFK